MIGREKKFKTRRRWRFTTRYFLDYDYIRNYYRLIIVDLSTQKELDYDLKGIQQIEFVG